MARPGHGFHPARLFAAFTPALSRSACVANRIRSGSASHPQPPPTGRGSAYGPSSVWYSGLVEFAKHHG